MFACSKDEEETNTDDEPIFSDASTCQLQRTYIEGLLSQSYEKVDDNTFRVNSYSADTILSYNLYETDTEDRLIRRTRFDYADNPQFYTDYIYIGSHESPDTLKAYSYNDDGILERNNTIVSSYEAGSCFVSLKEIYSPDGTFQSYLEYEYLDENCSYVVYDYFPSGSLYSHEVRNYDSGKSPTSSTLPSFSNPHNLTKVEDVLTGVDYYTIDYEYNEFGYPVSATNNWINQDSGSSSTYEVTYEYSCD